MNAAARQPSIASSQALDFLSAIWALDHALHQMSKRMTAAVGVTGPQRLVIRLIAAHPNITAGVLARTLHLHPSTLTGVLARLERDGLVRRTVDSADRRSSRLILTASGRRIGKQRTGTIEAAVEAALVGAPPGEVNTATRLLAAVTEALGATHTAGRSRRRHSVHASSQRSR